MATHTWAINLRNKSVSGILNIQTNFPHVHHLINLAIETDWVFLAGW